MSEMLLIINADDLGATLPINDAIFALMEQGIVTSATLLANGAAFEDAVRRLKTLPQCSFGVHLNLTHSRPLCPTPGLQPILNSQGDMCRCLGKIIWTPALMHAMYIELKSQVQRCLDAGVRISHFDSHHHIHTLPIVFPILKALQRRYAVRRIRGTINVLPVRSMERCRAMKKVLYRVLLKSIFPSLIPEGFGSFRDFKTRLSLGLPFGWQSIELMVHPGVTSAWGKEEDLLLRADWRAEMTFPYHLGNFWDLHFAASAHQSSSRPKTIAHPAYHSTL